MESEVTTALEQGATVITANRRLARHLAAHYAAMQQGNGRRVWETPDVLPWSGWLARSWASWFDRAADGEDPPLALLAPEQEAALWETVIHQCERSKALFDARSAAKLAREAWELWHAWHLPLRSTGGAYGPDTRAFLMWAAAFKSTCEAQRLLDSARLCDAVADGFAAGRLAIPSKLLLVGFDEFTPQQRALLDVLRGAGCDVVEPMPGLRRRGRAVRVSATDAKREIALAARWARARLEEKPAARIGIIVPALGQLRERLTAIFEDVFYPDAVLPEPRRGTPAFNLSLGRPLSEYPVIHSALTVLELRRERLGLNDAGDLLRTPFLGGGETEMSRRALLDARLRETGEAEVSRRTLLRFAEALDASGKAKPHASPQLATMLRAFERVLQSLPARQAPGAWARAFTRLLQAVAWPGERTLTSEEFQAVEAWGRALDALASLERLLPALTYAQALAHLRQIAQAPFQPESPEAPVQVLGMLEAAGGRFDYLWLMGMHDEAWPNAARPNPLLPIALQRAHGVPHASAAREITYARNVLDRLFDSAPAIIASYSERDGDRDLSPSPLIADLDEVARERLPVYADDSWEALIYDSAAIETLTDHAGPALEVDAETRGGVRLLEDQAACPFRAFAIYRLGAHGLEEGGAAPDAMARGSLVHAALERLWSELKNHRRLCELAEAELAAVVRTAANGAIDELSQRREVHQKQRFFMLEQQRLETLLLAWLKLEKQRAPFEVVALEEKQTLRLGTLNLRTRVDRIDRLLDGGGRLIIDYKSGEPKTPAWFDDRPEQPQLPLYSVFDAADEAPIAVLLAHVRQGVMQYKGVAAQDALAPGIKALGSTKEGKIFASWAALLQQWRHALEQLALEIRTGRAVVAPKRYPDTCQFCELPTLCRRYEVFAEPPEPEDESA